MQQKMNASLQRALCMLLSVAMVLSMFVMPVGAAATVLEPNAADLKTSVDVYGANAYGVDNGVAMSYGTWLSTLYLDSGFGANPTIVNFVDSKAVWVENISLMPAKDAVGGYSEDYDHVSVSYGDDGSFTIKENGFDSYAYGYLNTSIPVSVASTTYIYAKVTGDAGAKFNVFLTYTKPDGTTGHTYSMRTTYTAATTKDDDLPVSENIYFYDISGSIPAESTITQIQYYVVGDNLSITYHDLGLVTSHKANDGTLTADSATEFSLPGYTVVLVEHMGGDSERFFVDAVIDGEEYSDEFIHQLKPKMHKGFVLYVPDAAWTNGVPSRGDIVTAGWSNSNNVFRYESTSPTYAGSRLFDNNGKYAINFYKNSTDVVKPFTSDATAYVPSVNATVQMFNYNTAINQNSNPLRFWNGFWGYSAEVESVDGSGIEDNTYRYPAVSSVLGADGYPAFYTYVEDADGTHYKTGDGKFVPVADAGEYSGVITDKKYSLDESKTVSLGYLFGKDAAAYGTAGANGVTAYAPQNDGAGLFRYDPNTGNYFYDSMQNAAWYDTANNKFVLYDSLIVRPWYNSNGGDDYDRKADNFNYDKYMDAGFSEGSTISFPESYGNFLPFNPVTNDNITLDGAVYEYGDHAADDRFVSGKDFSATVKASNISGTLEAFGLLPAAAQKVLASNKSLGVESVEKIANTYQYSTGLYTGRLQDKLDMWFGMYVDFDFYQPQNGQVHTETGEIKDMVFDFEGDDDVFVYIGVWNGTDYDYKLVLDIGGIHEARKGIINFSTGAVTYTNCYGEEVTTTLGEIFGLNGEDTFSDFTKLSLKFYYMERGGNISCCRLSINIPTLPENSLTIGKALDQNVLGTQSYNFRVMKATENGATDEILIPEGTEYTITGTNQKGKVGADGFFTLAPGQSVTFADQQWAATHYVVEEVITGDVDGQFTVVSPTCTVNGAAVAVTESVDGETYTYRTAPIALNTASSQSTARASNMAVVGFTNMIETDQLGTLKITKRIKEGADINENQSFVMRVTIGGKLLPVGTTYILKDANGESTVTVEKAGIVSLKKDQTAIISGILSTSSFEVTEVSQNVSPTYSSTSADVTVTGSNASGVMPLGGDIEIVVTNDDSDGLALDKTVASVDGDPESFVLTLEAYSQGSKINVTKPADIVLVLDRSASMYTPAGAPKVLDKTALYDGLGSFTKDKLDSTMGQQLGYYVAQSKDNKIWFYLRYNPEIGDGVWEGFSVLNTESFVNPEYDPVTEAEAPKSYTTQHVQYQSWSYAELPDALVYYKSQYAILYDAVMDFVEELKFSGVEHRVGLIGFAGANSTRTELYLYAPADKKEENRKTYSALYHNKNTTDARRTELYQMALKNVQVADDYARLLQSIKDFETNHSFTCPAAGLRIADGLLAANEVNAAERDRIVVLFTDGLPNSMINTGSLDELKDGDVSNEKAMYNQIISLAHSIKSKGAKVYTVSTSTLGTADRDFLKYASSDYPDAEEMDGNAELNQYKYSMEVDGADNISVAFDTITKETSIPLDGKTVLKEYLSDYFQLESGSVDSVEVYAVAYDGEEFEDPSASNKLTIGTDVTVTITCTDPDCSHSSCTRPDLIEVTGFNYQTEYISDTSRTQNGTITYGRKLVVKVKVKARDGFWGGNNVPTNESATGIYTPDGATVDNFPMPEVNVPIGVQIDTVDRTVYYGNETNADVLFNQISVDVCGTDTHQTVKLVDGKPVLTGIPEWVNKFVELNVTMPESINSTEPGSYTYSVELKPTKTGTMNQSTPPSNMAGNPVGAVTANDIGNIYVLVPQYTFKDSAVKIGATNDMADNLAVDLDWVNMAEGEIPDEATKIGEAPSLNLGYSVSDSTKIYEDTAVDVTVISPNDTEKNPVQNVTKFKWESCNDDHHKDSEGNVTQHLIADHTGGENSNEFWIHVLNIMPDTVVIDFGLDVEIHVLENDMDSIVAPVLYAINTSTCQYGTAQMDGNTVKYSVNTMSMNAQDTFTYTVYSNAENTNNVENFTPQHIYSATVTVIPATTIYYEDNFKNSEGNSYITYDAFEFKPGEETSSDSTATWTDAGTAVTGQTQAEDRPCEKDFDADNIYGYDGSYTSMANFSMGSAKKFTTSMDSNGKITYGTATFSFTGTGFDVISVTSGVTGTITVKVTHQDKDKNGKIVTVTDKAKIVDTYYGYRYDATAKKWTPAGSNETDVLYQVPVIKISGLDYRTYDVTITVSYNAMFDHNKTGSYDFYLDAIRIYDPANDGKNNPVIEDAYKDDQEGWPEYFELRNLIIKQDAFESLTNPSDTANGIVFIDGNAALSDSEGGNLGTDVDDEKDPLYGKNPEIVDYANFGPNNELYLAPGQAISFDLNVPDIGDAQVASIQLALKSVGGTAKVKVYDVENADAFNVLTEDGSVKTIFSATDLYYNIKDLNNKTVVIANIQSNQEDATDAILSITNVKVTYTKDHGEDNLNASFCTVSQQKTKLTLRSLRHLFATAGVTAAHEAGEPEEKVIREPGCTTEGEKQVVVKCAVCGTELSSETVSIPAAGHGDAVTYVNGGDTHSATYDCCGDAYVTDEAHTYHALTHLCVCGAEAVEKNGIYAESGKLFYYEDGVRTYAGLIMVDGDYYYVRTSGEVVAGRSYWITKNNDLLPCDSYYFDKTGKLCDKNGFVEENGGIYYYENGQRTYAGLIYVDGNHYYVRTSGQVVTGRNYWITKTNDLLPAASYYFDEEGKMYPPHDTVKTGIYEENGKLFYYENGERTYGGLMQYSGSLHKEDGTVVEGIYDNAYIYVRTSGEVVAGRSYWITKSNDLLPAANYKFDSNGIMINPKA